MNAPTVGGVFDGIGLLAFGLALAGFDHAWLCESDPWRRTILERRWPGVPIFDDVRAVGARTAKRVDLIAGGFPCKGASTAGKREGFGHAETVLWREMARAVGELRPRYVLVENVANILTLHDGAVWGEVLGGLAALGYDVVWDCLPAAAVGAPHLRDRVFAIATDAECVGQPPRHPIRQGGPQAERSGSNAPDTEGGAKGTGESPRGQRSRWAGSAVGAAPAPDTARDAEGRPAQEAGADRQRTRARTGFAVEWGEYELAIRRWEAIHGPAPQPLVRRMDARDAARVERSRLSALGDGVQVQVGRIAGEHIMSFEREPRSGISGGRADKATTGNISEIALETAGDGLWTLSLGTRSCLDLLGRMGSMP